MSARLDAVVIGAGPAGAIAAMLLARAGRRVMLVERAPRGRDKTCGHCLNGRIMALARRLGIDDAIDAATVARSTALSLRTPGLPPIDATLVPPGLVVDRPTLDAALVRRAADAGCEVVQAAARLRASADPPWTIELAAPAEPRPGAAARSTVVETHLVIGADGIGSGVARALGWADRRPGRAFGFSGDLDGSAMPELAAGTIAMHVVDDGYLGTVRRDDGWIHVGALVRTRADARAPKAFVDAMAVAMPQLERIAACPPRTPWRAVGPLPWRPRRIAGPGAALIGDAAGYGEPFTGEGMAWAVESAAMVCDVALGATRFDARHAAEYDRRWRGAIGRSQRRCALVARLATRPAMLRVVGRVAPALPRAIAARVVAA